MEKSKFEQVYHDVREGGILLGVRTQRNSRGKVRIEFTDEGCIGGDSSRRALPHETYKAGPTT